MNPDDLKLVMVRDLEALAREVAAYPDDATPWQPVPGIANAGGTLVLHLAGNVQHFIGHILGGSGYVRDRDAEFARRGVTRAEMGTEVKNAVAQAARVLPALTTAQMDGLYPIEVNGKRMTTRRWLTHLASHLAYHLGQVDYHRRMVAPATGTVGTMSMETL